uniref:Putative secreted peptide n=1 Tax=Anopheles braziliensis TaxID=58242 RepID=A0A2M3ZQV4_9DIPT
MFVSFSHFPFLFVKLCVCMRVRCVCMCACASAYTVRQEKIRGPHPSTRHATGEGGQYLILSHVVDPSPLAADPPPVEISLKLQIPFSPPFASKQARLFFCTEKKEDENTVCTTMMPQQRRLSVAELI